MWSCFDINTHVLSVHIFPLPQLSARYTTPVRDICTFAVLCSVSRLFSALLLFMKGT